MQMTRRGFLKTLSGIIAAPYVITTPGVLMPVRAIWTPPPVTGLALPVSSDGVGICFNLELGDLISYYTIAPSGALEPEIDRHGKLRQYLIEIGARV